MLLLALCLCWLSGFITACMNPSSTRTAPDLSWVATPTLIANTVLHWRQVTYVSTSRSSDPANGKPLLGDLWVQVGADGQVILFKALYTYLDGTFHQAMLETTSSSLLVEGKDYVSSQPGQPSPGWCVQRQLPNIRLLQSDMPLFVNEAALAQDGFQRRGGTLTKSLPSTPTLPAIVPLQAYEGQKIGQLWAYQQFTNDSTREITTVEVGSQERLLVEEIQTLKADGTSLQASWSAMGPLYVYDAAAIPASDLTLPTIFTTGACNL